MYKVDGDFVDTFRIFVQEIPIFGKVTISNVVKLCKIDVFYLPNI